MIEKVNPSHPDKIADRAGEVTPMTDESDQDRARARLEQYQAAVAVLQYLRDRIETIEAKLFRTTTPPDSSAGWTGQTSDPKAGEKVMVGMIDLIVDYEQKALAAVQLCQTIESEIDRYCTGNQVNVLKYRYIEGLTYEAIAKRMMYSERHLFRLIDEALETFGLQSKRCHEMS